jgi:ssDNA-binding Zn-finger/Zn-ribbon topoisomerase 1
MTVRLFDGEPTNTPKKPCPQCGHEEPHVRTGYEYFPGARCPKCGWWCLPDDGSKSVHELAARAALRDFGL